MLPSRQICVTSFDAMAADSGSATRHPMMRRLQTSIIRYRCRYKLGTVVGSRVMSQLQIWLG